MSKIQDSLVDEARKVNFVAFLEQQQGWHFNKEGKNCYRCVDYNSFMINLIGVCIMYIH